MQLAWASATFARLSSFAARSLGAVPSRISLPICLEISLGVIAIVAFVSFSEAQKHPRQIAALTALAFYCVLLALLRRPRQAALATLILAVTIWAISKIKTLYLGSPFVFDDLFNMVGYNFWWVLTQYIELAIAAATCVLAYLALSVWLSRKTGPRISLASSCVAGLLAVIMANAIPENAKRIYYWDQNFDETEAGIGVFTASVVWWWKSDGNTVTLYNVAKKPLAKRQTPSEQIAGDIKPNIFMVLNESIFDPRVLGFPIEEKVADYFQPSEGLFGSLSVNVHGGGTWVSEFSAITGLDIRDFGSKALYLPALMEDRVHHSLIHVLKDEGYRILMVYCLDGKFMNAENFYRSLGVQEFHVPEQNAELQHRQYPRDALFYDHALDLMSSNMNERRNKPIFMFVVTISNHSPHTTNLVSDDAFPDSRRWLSRNINEDSIEKYEEYYVRLLESIEDHRKLKSELKRRFTKRPTLLVRFGDHHPKFTKMPKYAERATRKRALHTTYFAIEAINGDLAARPEWGAGALDIAYLPTLTLEAAGLLNDPLFKVRRELLEICAGRSYACEDRRRTRLHRTLLDRGYLEVDRVETAGVGPGSKPH